MIEQSKFTGCFIGLAIGDAYGASFEGGIIERLLWKLIGSTSEGKKRYTDDTQMSYDLAQSYIENVGIDQDSLAQKFSANYKWSRGYGPSAAKLLKGIAKGKDWRELNRKKFPEGSLGNGAAMRAPIVALCHPAYDATLAILVKETAEITHAHPLAIEGAHLIAIATCMALEDEPNERIVQSILARSNSEVYRSKLGLCAEFLSSESAIENSTIKSELGNEMLATESCVTALYFALNFRSSVFEEMLDAIFSLGGDTDTIAAMAGGIWGAFNGTEQIHRMATNVEGSNMIEQMAQRLYENYQKNWLN